MTASPATTELDLATEVEARVTAIWWTLMREVPSDLSRTGASVLATLRQDGPQRVTTLAAHEHVAQPSMSLLLQRLAKRGLVERLEDPADKRACRMAITSAGEQVLRDRAQARSHWLRAHLEPLSAQERDTVVTALGLLDKLLPNGDSA